MDRSTKVTKFSTKDIKSIFGGLTVKPEAKVTKTAYSSSEDLQTQQTEMMAQSDKLG